MENKNLLEKIQNELDKNKSNFVNYELLSYVIEKSKQEDEHVLLVAMENGNIYITKYILDTMIDLNDNLMVLDRNGLDALQKGILFGRFYSAKLFIQYLIDYEVFSIYKLKRLNEIIEALEEFNIQIKQLKIGSTYFIDTLKKVIKNYYFDFVVDYFYLLKENNLKKHITNFIIELKDEKGISLFEIALDDGIESYLKIVESAELSLDTKELQNPFLEISQDTGSYDAKLRKGFIQLTKKEEWHWLYMLEKTFSYRSYETSKRQKGKFFNTLCNSTR